MITVQHRRATPEEWDAIDPIIPDGELALTKKTTGIEVRIGDGETAYSDLLPINGRKSIVISGNPKITLEDGDRVQCGAHYGLEITINPRGDRFFSALLSFDTEDICIMIGMRYSGEILFSGDDVYDGCFDPCTYTHYTLHLWYDGTMNCHIRGVYLGDF